MVISGALAGLGGVMEGLGTFQNAFASESLPSIGWDGMAVSLLGLNNPIGILFSALVFAILRIGGNFNAAPCEDSNRSRIDCSRIYHLLCGCELLNGSYC